LNTARPNQNPFADLDLRRDAEHDDAEYIRNFLLCSERTELTNAKYRSTLTEIALFFQERQGVSLCTARRLHVKLLMAYLKSDERMLAPSTRKGYLASLSAFYRWAMDMELVRDDATAGVERPKVPLARRLTLSLEELRHFLDAPGTEIDRILAFLFVFLAARTHEIEYLRWQDVDFENGLIHLLGKYGKSRTVPMSLYLRTALKRWRDHLDQLARTRPAVGRSLENPDTAWVVMTKNGRRKNHSGFAKHVKRRARRAGIAAHPTGSVVGTENFSMLSPHGLRRSWATCQLNAGISLGDIADILGHASVDTTRRHYAFTTTERKTRTIEAFCP
jgi:integrase